MGAIGPWQIVIVALIVLVLFGSRRLADIGKGLGEGIKNFKKGISDDGEEEKLTEGEGKESKRLPPTGESDEEKV